MANAELNVPFDRQVWSAERCAEFLEVSKTHFLNCIRYADGFPPPLPIPPYRIGGKERHMDPRWSAASIAAWAHGEFPQESRKAAANT